MTEALTREMWDRLPEESFSYLYESPHDLMARGAWCIRDLPNQPVTMQLGFAQLSFRCTLQAAWEAWPRFAYLSTDTYNSCVFPDDFGWYIVRAGSHLYPMLCTTGETPSLIARPEPGDGV